MKLPRLRVPAAGEATFAELMRALASEVAEADATFQLRQRLAWREATGGRSAVLEGLDRLGNLAVQEVRFTFQLEPAPRPWYLRLWDAVTRRPAARGATFRFVQRRRGQGAPAFQVSVSVGRNAQGAWDTTLEGLPPGAAADDVALPALDA